MERCRACNGNAVVWEPFMMSTADIPHEVLNEQWKEHQKTASKCPVCDGRGMVPDGFYDFKVPRCAI